MAQTVEEARAALAAAEAKLASAGTTRERIAASKEAAEARKDLQAANAAARAQARELAAQAEAEEKAKAEAERPKTGAEMAEELKGVRPVLQSESGGPFGGYVDYKPLDEAARRAIFGYNPATGKAYTNEESAAISGGYNPWAGAIGYEIDPRTGNLNVLNKDGTVSTTGATYQYTPKGFIVPSDAYMENFPGFGYDQEGRMINAQGQLITQTDIDTYNSLAKSDPSAAREFARGKGFSSTVINSGTTTTSQANIPVTTVNNAKVLTSAPTGTVSNLTTSNLSTTGMTSAQQDVYSIMLGRLNQYNLGSLAPLIRKLAIEGATESTIMLQLSEDPLYKERFKANESRKQRGLSVLTPSQYLSLEDDYRQVLRAYGLTQFDNDAYVSQFIANDVSVSELSNRVVTAVQRVRNADPAVSNMLKNLYGIGQNDLVAYVLDPQQQFQKIERQVAASEIGAAAARQGFAIGATVAEQLAAQGISQAEAQKGYATIADILPTAEKLSDIYGGQLESYRLPEAEQEVFNQLASAQRKRRALAEREVASFSGQAGLGRTSLTQQTGGQF